MCQQIERVKYSYIKVENCATKNRKILKIAKMNKRKFSEAKS